MKICIFGGGAIGGYLAAHLAREGSAEVSMVARGAALEAIQRDGLEVETPAGIVRARPAVSGCAKHFGPQDYVFLTLKANQLSAALPQIAPLVGANTAVMPPTTGLPHYFFRNAPLAALEALDPGGLQAALMPEANLLGVVYWIGAHSILPGRIAQDGPNAGCPIGEIDGSASPRAMALAALLSASGIPSKVNSNILGAIWVKFVNSLCWNPLAILTLARIGEIVGSGCGELLQAMMEEADAAARALGVTVPQPPDRRISLTASAAQHKMSMLQDLEKGRPMEFEVLDASIGAVQRLTGLAMPTLSTVLALARLRVTMAEQQTGLRRDADG